MGAETKVKAKDENPNLRIWDDLAKTDPAHTKPFNRAGGFKGTAIKPIYIIQRLTEKFGPCGEGWGIGEPKFELVHSQTGEVLVFCTVSCWHGERANLLFGVGGDKAVTLRNDGKMFHDDEAFKKAFTDAVGNAFKFLGVSADVHMGQFDDNKYVEQMRDEFSDGRIPVKEPEAREKLDGPHTSKTALRKAITDLIGKVRKVETVEALDTLKDENKHTINQARRDWPTLIDGDPNIAEDVGLAGAFALRREQLTLSDDARMCLETLDECTSSQELEGWFKLNWKYVEGLDGAERDRVEARYQELEAGLKQLDVVTN
jgi:hypothetical protein